MPDKDGYPTDAELVKITQWAAPDWSGLMDFVEGIWSPYGRWERSGDHIWCATGGWSGNESIMGALNQNTLFWMFCWTFSGRGGHHGFKLIPEQKSLPSPPAPGLLEAALGALESEEGKLESALQELGVAANTALRWERVPAAELSQWGRDFYVWRTLTGTELWRLRKEASGNP